MVDFLKRVETAVTTEAGKIRAELVAELDAAVVEAKSAIKEGGTLAKDAATKLRNDVLAVWEKLHHVEHVETSVANATKPSDEPSTAQPTPPATPETK